MQDGRLVGILSHSDVVRHLEDYEEARSEEDFI
jgi:hypothetical protein